MASLFIKRGKYYIDYFINRKRISENTKIIANYDPNSGDKKRQTQNYKKALKLKTKIEKKIQGLSFTGAFESAPKPTPPHGVISLIKAVDLYKKAHMSLKSNSHQKNFDSVIKHLYKVTNPNSLINSVTQVEIAEFIGNISHLSNATTRTYLTYLIGFFNYLVDDDILMKSPIKKNLKIKSSNKKPVTFTPRIYRLIFDEAKKMEAGLYEKFKMLALTGLRPCDMLKLRGKNFTHDKIQCTLSKTQINLTFPIYEDLKKFFIHELPEVYELEDEEKLFKNYSVSLLGDRFTEIKKTLNITGKYVFTLKTFRKSFATDLANVGVNESDLADLLGHTSTAMVRKYYVNKKAEATGLRVDEALMKLKK